MWEDDLEVGTVVLVWLHEPRVFGKHDAKWRSWVHFEAKSMFKKNFSCPQEVLDSFVPAGL